MPKKIKKIQSKIFYMGPSSRGKFGKYLLRMTYDSQYLEYKKGFWKKLYFKKIVSWEAFAGGYIGTIMDSKRPPRIVLKTTAGRTAIEERKFDIPFEDFDKWLYFIISSIMKYSKATIPDEYLNHLSQKNRSRINMRRFDLSHEVFIAVSESLQAGLDAKRRVRPAPVPVGFHPDIVQGQAVEGRTRGGLAYGHAKRSIGKGGSQTVIFEIDRLLQPILMRDEDGSNPRIVRPAEPVAVKVPKYHEFNEGKDWKDLVREARVLAAIGKHRNIIGLIDAQLASKDRLYLFLEMGDHDMGDFRLQKKHPITLPTLPVIRKWSVGILAGIAHMNQQRIYHLDMKPENVLICDNIPKIIDFGLAKAKALDSKQEMLSETWQVYGTALYISPESWTPDAISNENHLAKRDSYAVGMTLFEVLLGPCFNKQRLNPGKSVFNDTPTIISQRIKHWQNWTQNAANIKKFQKKGLLGVAKAASGLIEEDPTKRLFVEHALELVRDDLRIRREKRGLVNRGRMAQSARIRSSSQQVPVTVKPARVMWKCRNCNRSFPYKPTRCTCLMMVHPDGDPLFIRA